jgi:hypothetical protein
VAVLHPFDKLKLPDKLWPQPSALFHLRCGQPRAPPAGFLLRQVGKRLSAISNGLIFLNSWAREAGVNPFRVRAA